MRISPFCWAVALSLLGAQSPANPVPIFEDDIQPIFNKRCSRCHNPEKKRAALDLTSLAGVMKGGESGMVISPGHPEKSLLYEKVHKGEMPPNERARLSHTQVELIELWLKTGAKARKEVVQKGPEVTQHQIEPLLRLRCTVCHGLRKQEAGLDLRTKASILKGGKSGPAMVPGKPEESLLLKRIHAQEMPPRSLLIRSGVKPMLPDEIARLTKWIAIGAPEVEQKPDVATGNPDPLVTEDDRSHWAFQPPALPSVPAIQSPRIRNAIDAFILEKLQENGLTFSAEADRITLLRRACFDLTGLPPTVEEMERYLRDPDPMAYEKLIERLLASPKYGERWGRYWLDLCGYADSEGKRSADPIRPHAWRYRDYVIQSLNADKPYDRFLMEQIAGDELADYRKQPVTPEVMANLVATGFLRMAPDGTGSDIVNSVPERLEVVSDQIQILGGSVLGLTLHCARCHSHKYDPIPQRDYYRLVDVFKGAYDEHDWLKPSFVRGQTKAKVPGRVLPFLSEEEKAQWEAYRKDLKVEIDALKKKKQDRDVRLQLRALETVYDQKPMIRSLWDRGEPSPTYIYQRGDFLQPGQLVGPGVPSVLNPGNKPFEVKPPYPGAKSTGRRLALAKWLTDSNHPLTARVMVNRIWKHHFGQGLVTTLANFGRTGARPSHPELLDWMSRTFVEKGWSLKAMHRLMMTSATYRQGSRTTEVLETKDPKNTLLSRMPLQRLQAESLRDSLLFVSGQLSDRPFGPPDPVSVRKDGLVTSLRGKNGWRRSIYVRQRRSQIPTLLENFDLPQMNPNCARRVDSTVVSQALHLMNNRMIEEIADYFAQRILEEVNGSTREQIERAYRLAFSRSPSTEERALGEAAVDAFRQHWHAHTKNTEMAKRKAMASYCHTLLSSAGFLYID